MRILAAAPVPDLNSDGAITAEKFEAASDKLPESLRDMLDSYLESQGVGTRQAHIDIAEGTREQRSHALSRPAFRA